MNKADIGIVGLGVMGRMLALNMARNGFRVAGYDLDGDKVLTLNAAGDGKAVGYQILGDFFGLLERPRKILMMVPAGKPVDAVIAGLRPALDRGDLLIDGGNSHFRDTERRAAALEADGIRYIGTGVSGGEYGALWGPSIMPGGDPKAWSLVRPIFEAISAKVAEPDGTLSPCVAYIGPQGAGHFVKMVHNGIEYGDMQLIAETYDVLHRGLGLSALQLRDIFARWNEGDLQSYLIEITRDIFATLDEETGKPLVDVILDEAQHKGTGKWTSQSALDLGAAAPMISAAVEARMLSSYKEERVRASKFLGGPKPAFDGDVDAFVDTMERAMYAAKICSYAQGFGVLRAASMEYEYDLNYGEIAKIWRGGCIIRAQFLNKITAAFARDANLPNLLLDASLGKAVEACQDALRQVICYATTNGVPMPVFSSALAYFDAYRSERLPANLLQSQRDYFGAHTYRRIDREGTFHTDWAAMGKATG